MALHGIRGSEQGSRRGREASVRMEVVRYHEIQQPKAGYRLIDHETLQKLLHVDSHTALAAAHRGWISSQLKPAPEHEERYSKSIALGSSSFVETLQAKMGIKAVGRRSRESSRDAYELQETVESYGNENT